ncbi:hypothetical protein [uncultured Maribacter sp.]|uniref:hypothetical protein n=1 Tax=uncultured Maribacter sp. TaxID=431308 RepID=UPI0026207928|nr:hypothetical protein [uncultured Maribacter sp.]
MKNTFIILLLITSNLVSAQIKIGDNPQIINTASLLELESTSKVLVISRMTESQMLVLSPLQGAMVYNTDASCIYYYDGIQWNNLCAGEITNSISWGSLTGSLSDQTDIAAEFENYVNLSTTQSVAGEKTLTNKFTVDTGNLDAQIAEFLGRVKGEEGTAPEDFVTKAQLDASGGASSWGAISGDLVDQIDLASEFDNYVDITTTQSVAGEKTLTDKLTINTGDVNAQIAEFLGRVKGEQGTAPEDFVTKAQLDASGGAASWGAITGELVDQTDLVAEFENHVNLSTTQSVAGEKTLTDKLTVNTGDSSIQVAEFQGRVKGEDGTAPEDFVTRLQLDAITAGGHTGAEGSVFFAGDDTQPTEDNANFYYDITNKQLKVGAFIDRIQDSRYSDDFTTLSIEGSVSKPIGISRILTEEHHTTLISNSTFVTLPDPSTCVGRIYIIKTSPKNAVNPLEDTRVQITGGNFYNDAESIRRTEFPSGSVTQLQSSGQAWEQIN